MLITSTEQQVTTGADVSISIVSGLHFSRKKGEEYLKEFIEKQLTSHEKVFWEPIKRTKEKTERSMYFERSSTDIRSLCCEAFREKRF